MLMTLPGKRTKMNRNVTTDHNTTRPSGYRDRQSGKLQSYRSFAATHLHVYMSGAATSDAGESNLWAGSGCCSGPAHQRRE